MYRLYRFMYGLVGFSRSQTNGFLIFLPLLFVVVTLPWAVERQMRLSATINANSAFLDSLVAVMSTPPLDTFQNSPWVRFSFDPNTSGQEELRKLGFNDALASRLIRYRERGGVFRQKSDLLKVWGMDSVLYEELAPYVMISRPKTSTRDKHFGSHVHSARQIRQKFDLNKADTAMLKEIYGIGNKLSQRIVKYRDALGGFVTMNQLWEIYRIDSAVVDRLRNRFLIEPGFEPRKININTVERQDLATHPYITDKAASAIVAYRLNHGSFNSIDDIAKIPALDSITLRKSRPYLKISE